MKIFKPFVIEETLKSPLKTNLFTENEYTWASSPSEIIQFPSCIKYLNAIYTRNPLRPFKNLRFVGPDSGKRITLQKSICL